MSTQEETKDLLLNPLPPEISIAVVDYVTNCPADRVLTNITLIDAEIEKIQQALKPYLTSLGTQREKLLTRAKDEKITEDSEAVLIEIPGRQMRNEISDNEAFAEIYPAEVKAIRDLQRADIQSKFDVELSRVDHSKIPLTLADKKVGKEKVTAFVGYKASAITYEVQRKVN